MSTDAQKLYEILCEKAEANADAPGKVAVRVGNETTYRSLLRSLYRINADMRALFGAQSVCSDFDAETGRAQFWLGKPRRKHITFTLLDDSDA
jgi:hypothetical protein